MYSSDSLNIIHFFITGVKFLQAFHILAVRLGTWEMHVKYFGRERKNISLARQRHRCDGEIKIVIKNIFGLNDIFE